jgi:hypothetical protein
MTEAGPGRSMQEISGRGRRVEADRRRLGRQVPEGIGKQGQAGRQGLPQVKAGALRKALTGTGKGWQAKR